MINAEDVEHTITPFTICSRDNDVLERDRKVLENKFQEEVAVFISWMVHPYAKSFAIFVFGFMIYQSIFNPVDDAHANGLRGLGAAIVVYLLVCSWQLRDSLLVRPHPVFWRIIKGLAFLYCFGLVWLIFQNVGDARQVLAIWDPVLGVELEEKSYAATCAVYTPEDPVSNFRNIRDALIDEYGNFDTFILCHVLGWFCKMIMLRDLRLTLVASLLFEMYELSLAHMLPNFAECWWDTMILDVIVCNGFGIFVGYYWLKFWKCKEYNFFGYVVVNTVVDGKQKTVQKWKPLVSFRFFIGGLVVLAALAVIELNAFFLKFILWVPPPHHLNLGRIIFWWLLGCAGTREWYYWVENENSRTGMNLSLIFCNGVLESIICYKMGAGLFPVTAPFIVKLGWTLAFISLASFAALYFPIQYMQNKGKQVKSVISSSAAVAPTLAEGVDAAEGCDTKKYK